MSHRPGDIVKNSGGCIMGPENEGVMYASGRLLVSIAQAIMAIPYGWHVIASDASRCIIERSAEIGTP